ncbi:MAG: hypothetical protein KC593_02150 [Myxococcales bacterium]|nr:hypothetical protein [Myxococcales bacterium]MCB9627752.1 hypothetical protein [Sandaracinaceae bacterium]
MSDATPSHDLSVERLCRRLGAIPGVFLEATEPGQAPLATHAILYDLVLVQSGEPASEELVSAFTATSAAVESSPKGKKRSASKKSAGAAVAPTQRAFLARLLAWLLMDDAFRGTGRDALEVALEAPMSVLECVAARQFVEDSDRREELVRLTLRNLGLAPADERREDAEDRLSALDSVRRVRLLQEARAAEDARRQRERELAAELARKQAEEQAARYDREY